MVLKCSFPGFILAPRSMKKEYDQWSYTTHLTAFWTFLDRYQNRCSLFILPFPHRLLSSSFAVWSKRVCFKIRVHRKYLCFCPLCGTVCVPGVSSSSHRESQLVGPLKSQSGPRRRSNAGWQDQPIRTHACTHSHLGESVKTHLFTCYAGKSRLHVLLVSLWQQVVGRHFPENEASNV